MGFDFTLIVPLLPSHFGFSSVLGHGVSSLVKSRVFLSMTVQQPVVILVLSQEGVRACPSTPPSWLMLLLFVINWNLEPLQGLFLFMDSCLIIVLQGEINAGISYSAILVMSLPSKT